MATVAGLTMIVALGATAVPAGAKGEPLHAREPLLRRATDDDVTIRAARGAMPDEWGPAACDGPGCLPKACHAKGMGWLGLSTPAAVGEGQFEIYPPTGTAVAFAASGTFGTIVDHPVGWVVVRTGPKTSEVTARFRYGGRDAMRPVHGWAVLAAPLHDVPAVQVLPPTTTITARDADGARLAAITIDADTPYPSAPEPCPSPLAQRFPKLTGRAPADEDAARAEVTAAYVAAYGGGGERAGLASVQDGATLADVARVASERFPQYAGKIRPDVEEVRFIDRDEAAVRFGIDVLDDDGTTSPLGVAGVGRAVLRSGHWLVSRSTFCSILAAGATYCPIPERPPQREQLSAGRGSPARGSRSAYSRGCITSERRRRARASAVRIREERAQLTGARDPGDVTTVEPRRSWVLRPARPCRCFGPVAAGHPGDRIVRAGASTGLGVLDARRTGSGAIPEVLLRAPQPVARVPDH